MPARRVTIVTHTAALGGAETALLRLATALDPNTFVPHVIVMADGPLVGRLADAGIDCTLVGGGAVTTVTRAETASVGRIPAMARGTLGGASALATALRASGAELAVANSLKSAVMLSVAARRARIPWVWHLHDRLAADYLPRRAVTGMRALAAARPRVIVANSKATMETLGARGQRKAVVAYPGLEDSAFYESKREPVRGTIGLLGRISETKGQFEFVEAAALLHAQRPALRFRIVGSALFSDGDYEARVRDAARGLPDGLVTFAGWVDDPGAELRGLELLVHASPVPEPFGQVVVEAMAAGVPVIATRAGGIVEILDPGSRAAQVADGVWTTRRGLLAAPGDPAAMARAIGIALDDPAGTSARAAQAATAARSEFAITATAAIVQAAWLRALGEGEGPR